MVIPSGSDFGHPVPPILVIGFSSFSVLESTASNGIYSNEDNKHHNIEDRELVPVPFDIFKNSCLARIALVA